MKLTRNKRILAAFAAFAILAGVLCANLVIVRANAETTTREPKDIVLVDLNAEKDFAKDRLSNMGGTVSVEKVDADAATGFPGGTAYVDKLPGKAIGGIAKNAGNYPADFGKLESSYVFDAWVYIDDIAKVNILRFDLSQNNGWDQQGYTFQVNKTNDIDQLTAGTQTMHTGWNHFVVPMYKIGLKGNIPTQINSFRFFEATAAGSDVTLKLASLVLRDRAADGYTNGFTAADEKKVSDTDTQFGNRISVKDIATLTAGTAVEGQPTSGTAYSVDYKSSRNAGKTLPGIGFENLGIEVAAATTMKVDAWVYVPAGNNLTNFVFRAYKTDTMAENNASVSSLVEGAVVNEGNNVLKDATGWQHFVKTVNVPAGKIGSVSFHNHKGAVNSVSFAIGSLKLTVDGKDYDVVTPDSAKDVSKVRNIDEEYKVVDTAELTGGTAGVPSGTAYYVDSNANAYWGLPLENKLDIDISNMASPSDKAGRQYYKVDAWIWVKDASRAKSPLVLRLFPGGFSANGDSSSYIESWKFNINITEGDPDLDEDTPGSQKLQNGWNHVVRYVDDLSGKVSGAKVTKITSALLYAHNNNGAGEGGASNRTSMAIASLQLVPVTEVNDVIATINALPAAATYADKAAVEAARAALNALDEKNQGRVNASVGTRLTDAEAAIAACEEKIAAVEEKIDAIGTVSLDSAAAIEEAETAYKELTDAEKAAVENADKLTAVRKAYDKLVADNASADKVIVAINEIGEVTLESETKIAAAEALYNALSDEQKALVTNAATLTAARAKLDALKADKDAQDAFNAKVDAIGDDVTLDSETAIKEAEDAYNALTDTQKAAVAAAKAKLDEARAAYDAIAALDAKAKPVRDAIDAIGNVTLESKDAIEAAEKAYDALTDAEKAYVTNYNTLKTARDTYNDLLESDKYPLSSPNFGFDVINSRYKYEVKDGAAFVDILPELGAGHDGSENGATYLRGLKAGYGARILTAGGTVKFVASMESVVKFWVYISDKEVINQLAFELSDTQDNNEKEWQIKDQIKQNGWNEITVDFSSGTGKLDLNNIRFWRCFIVTKAGDGTYDFGLDDLTMTGTSKPGEQPATDFDEIVNRYNKVTSGFNYSADAIMDGWKYDGGPKVDTEEKKEGTGSLRFDTKGSKVLGIIQSKDLNVDMTNAWNDGYVGFWLYVNDCSEIDQVMMEISSNNEIDKNEYQIALAPQVTNNGWNYVVFKLSDMKDQQAGTVDKASIQRFRLFVHGTKSGKDITLRIDDISLLTKKIGGDEVSGFGYDAENIETGKYDYSGTGAKIDTDAKQGSGSVRFDTKDEKAGNVLGLIRTKASNKLNFKVENPDATAVQFWVYVSNASAVRNAVFELASTSQDMDEIQWEFRSSLSDGWNQVTLMLKNGSRPATNPGGTDNAFNSDSINFWRVFILGDGTGETVTVKYDDIKMIVLDDENNKDPDKQFNDDCEEINDTKYQYIPTPSLVDGNGSGSGKAYEFKLANTSDADNRMRWVNRSGQLNFAIDNWKNSYITFDIYLSDPSLVKQLAFELSSIAVDASDELQYNVQTGSLTEGWNTVLVPLLAMDPGSLDLEHLRSSRIFLLADKSGEELTVRLDNIRLHNRNEQDESDESNEDSDSSNVTPDTSDRDNPNTGAASAVLPAALLLGAAAVTVVTLRRRRGN